MNDVMKDFVWYSLCLRNQRRKGCTCGLMVISCWSAQPREKVNDKNTQEYGSIYTLTFLIRKTDWISLGSFTLACAHCHVYVCVSRCKLQSSHCIFCDGAPNDGSMNRCQQVGNLKWQKIFYPKQHKGELCWYLFFDKNNWLNKEEWAQSPEIHWTVQFIWTGVFVH